MGVWCKSIDGHTQLATTTPITAQILPLPFVCFRHQPPPVWGYLFGCGWFNKRGGVDFLSSLLQLMCISSIECANLIS